MARGISRLFTLTKYVDIELTRSTGKGDFDDTTGKWYPAPSESVVIKANIQPMKFSQTMLMDTAERTKEWVDVRSSSEIRKLEEGEDGWDADTFVWNSKVFKVMGVKSFKMGLATDHYHAIAALDSPTPSGI